MKKKRDQSKWRQIRVPVKLAEVLEATAAMWERAEVDIGATIDTPGRFTGIAIHEVIAELLRRDAAHRHRARKARKGSWEEQEAKDDPAGATRCEDE